MKSYVDPAKQRWHRAANLAVFDRLLPEKPLAARRLIYLDTREALQTIQLLKHGYAPENLLAVNRDAGEIAGLEARLIAAGRPSVVTRVGDLADAAFGVPADIIDFDGTETIGTESTGLIAGYLARIVEASTPRVVSFSIVCGREQSEEMDAIYAREDERTVPPTVSGRRVNPLCWHRAALMLKTLCSCDLDELCLWHVDEWWWDAYRSNSGMSMAWATARLTPHAVHATQRSQERAGIFRRATVYGLGPACTAHGYTRAPGCPEWSDEQFKRCGFSPEEIAATIRVAHQGWPTRADMMAEA